MPLQDYSSFIFCTCFSYHVHPKRERRETKPSSIKETANDIMPSQMKQLACVWTETKHAQVKGTNLQSDRKAMLAANLIIKAKTCI